MKFKEHAVGICQYDNIFDAENFIELLEEECSQDWGYVRWEKSATGEGQISNTRTSMGCELMPLGSNEISIERVMPLASEWQKIWEKIDPIVWDYRHVFELDLEMDEGYRVLKYGGGAEYHAHHDHFRNNARSLSLVAFLNDNFTGGNLVFPRFNVNIQPKAGSVIMFPSNYPYLHIAEPVGEKDNTVKYSLVTWFQ
jgi:hypothetical protein